MCEKKVIVNDTHNDDVSEFYDESFICSYCCDVTILKYFKYCPNCGSLIV